MRRLLVSNRGEIALRIMRTAKEMGLETVAVYSEADRDAAHVRYADMAFLIGPAPPAQSYLNVDHLLGAARSSGADAVHPGYGFLAENAAFANACTGAGLCWVGPHAGAIDAMGDKLRARRTMIEAGVPVVPGGSAPLASVADAEQAVKEYGLPLALKASGGGGGKGLKIAQSAREVRSAFSTARREAEAYFGNGTIYAERYLENPKHVELQILADKHGNVVHVGERDCSLQRRHQKLWEETPAWINEGVRERLREAGVRAARAIGYDSVGTIETLVLGDDFYFLEMNTRIQVEHTVTEMTSGLDLVREQIRVAAGEPLGYTQNDILSRGHAIEVRVNAEDPAADFRPSPGTLTTYREPAGMGVRVDSAAAAGFIVRPEYDSLIAKLIVWDTTREHALSRLRRALDDYHVAGVATTLGFLRALCDEPEIIGAAYGTATLERFAERYGQRGATAVESAHTAPAGNAVEPATIRVEVNDRLFTVRLLDLPLRSSGAGAPASRTKAPRPNAALSRNVAMHAHTGEIAAPMHGVVVELPVEPGAKIAQGQVVAVIEAMKMMNEIHAHRAGTVKRVMVEEGTTVEPNTPLILLE
ncbi:MAG: acetyl-CoA carboxylase biotin carboxylase subunit [Candidatus Eremiobacteraeota bacterium]|nr:acetyl-CoA carboxylase biotin carboxylase subunit [Candidatus Eremiobacteraeota bacterium]